MVGVSVVACIAILALGTQAKCKLAKAHFQPFAGTDCKSAKPPKAHKIKENDCKDYDSFNSFKVFQPDRAPHHAPAWKGRRCFLHSFDDKNCAGAELISEEMPTRFDQCQSKNFTGTAPGFHSARSVKLICQPLAVAAPSSKSMVDLVTTLHVPAASRVTIVSTPSSSSKSCCTSTVSTTPSSVKPSGNTATLMKTTTIITAPTATVEGTTTVWVAPTTSRRYKVNTYVVTVSDAPKVKRAVPTADTMDVVDELQEIDDQLGEIEEQISVALHHPTPTAGPSSVIRRAADSTECYASINGHWVLSSCSLPGPTSKASAFSS